MGPRHLGGNRKPPLLRRGRPREEPVAGGDPGAHLWKVGAFRQAGGRAKRTLAVSLSWGRGSGLEGDTQKVALKPQMWPITKGVSTEKAPLPSPGQGDAEGASGATRRAV